MSHLSREEVYSYHSKRIDIVVNATEFGCIDVSIDGVLTKQIRYNEWAEVPYLVDDAKAEAYLKIQP